MLSKSKTTKALLYSTAALSLFAASHVHADETSHWTARSVDQIKADISVNDNQQTYTVQYGDTLGSIVEAMGIDMNVLANIKEITNIDLIFPGTVLTTTYNADNQAVSVKVETPSSETSDTPVVAESNLTTNEVTVNGQSVVVSDLSAPVETVNLTATQAPAKDESTQVVSEVTEAIASDAPAYADTEQPVADAIDHHVTSSTKATEAPATETSAPASEAPVNETPVATSYATVNETPVATSEAPVNETPVATSDATVNETPVATSYATVNETPVATEEAPVNETPVATEAQPAAPVSEAPVNETSVVTEEAQPEPEPVLEAPVNETSVVTEEAQPAVLEVQPESTPNTYPVGQCTWGVKSLAPWAGNYWGNAKDWIASAQAAGHSVGTTPVAGAIAVWPNEGGGYGHVAYVTSASDEHSIQVMESNYAGNMSIGNYRGTFDPTAAWWGGSVYYIYP